MVELYDGYRGGRNLTQALLMTYEAVSNPKIVMAVGACAASGQVFGSSYAIRGAPMIQSSKSNKLSNATYIIFNTFVCLENFLKGFYYNR